MFKKGLVLAVMVTIVSLNCYAATINSTWVGGSSGGFWSNANKWNPNIVPDNDGNTFVVTIDSGVGSAYVALQQNRTIDQLDCYGEVGLEKMTPYWIPFTLSNGLTNYGDLSIDDIVIVGNVTNTAGAELELSGVWINGDLYNFAGATVEVEFENYVGGNIQNEGTLIIGNASDMSVRKQIKNTGQIQMYGGECGVEEILDNNSTGVISGFGILDGHFLQNAGQIYAVGGTLSIFTDAVLTNNGTMGNKPNASLHIEPGATVTVSTDTSWRAIGPVGNLQGGETPESITPIDSVGISWEASNPGWNSSLSYDDSAWGNAISSDLGWTFPADSIWVDGDTWNGATPSYFRKIFLIDETPNSGLLDAMVDDDMQFYLNGTLVIDDQDGNSGTDFSNIDITPYLVSGQNLIAVKAHDSWGGQEGLAMTINIEYSEPQFDNKGFLEVGPGGGVTCDCNLNNEPNGVINLLSGTLAATTITQAADANFTGFGTISGNVIIETDGLISLTGPTNIIGDVTVSAGATLQISDGQTLITGQTVNNGTIELIGGTVIFQGGYSGAGTIPVTAGTDRNHFDVNSDGIEDFKDFASFANSWLWQASWY